jgi:hypothetical protein
MTLKAMKNLPDCVSELKKSFIVETIRRTWKTILASGRFKWQYTPIVRNSDQYNDKECYYVLLMGKQLILSHCCDELVLFYLSKAK